MPWKSDMLAAFEDETLHDIRLVGTDNMEIPCSKFVLATRSMIFKKMFFGDFKERNSDLVSLNYCSTVLKVLVKYCYSDELDLDFILDAESLTDNEAMLLVELRDAAKYFEIPEVANHIAKKLGESVFHDGQLGCVCAILTELTVRVDDEGAFWNMFEQLVTKRADECLFPKDSLVANQGVTLFSPRLLRKILENVSDTYVAVCCLKKWFRNAKETGDDVNESSADIQALMALSKRLNLTSLSLQQLSKIEPCSVFSMQRLYEALVYHGAHPTPQRLFFPPSTFVYVSGAGVECLNGYYLYAMNCGFGKFFKYDKYGDLRCECTIEVDSASKTWAINVTPYPANGLDKITPLKMYEHISDGSIPEGKEKEYKIPFNCWKCLDGKAPAPYVAMILDGKEPLVKPSSPFSSLLQPLGGNPACTSNSAPQAARFGVNLTHTSSSTPPLVHVPVGGNSARPSSFGTCHQRSN
eukprot:scaffold4683_cov112-Cylindrotheca_fusiformis.AAC.2